MIKGIDVSQWQGTIDFKKVKNAGIDFVMIRAGYGEGYEDSYFEQNVYNADKNGLHVGAYYFVYANADNFIKLLSKFKGKIDYPVACDFEYESVDFLKQNGITPTKKLVLDITKAFCERVEKAGYYTMLYSNQDYLNLYYEELTKQYDLWYANWSDTKTRTVNMWQYSSKGRVNGINGDVDMDYSYLDFSKIIKERGLNFIKSDDVKDTNLKVGDTFEIGEISDKKIVLIKK